MRACLPARRFFCSAATSVEPLRALAAGMSVTPRGWLKTLSLMMQRHLIKKELAVMAPQTFRSFDEDLPRGAEGALRFLADKLSSADVDALSDCLENTLCRPFEEVLRIVKENEFKVHFEILKVHKITLDKVVLIMGAQRGEALRDRRIRAVFGHHIVEEKSDVEKARQGMGSEHVREILDRGNLLLVDCEVTVSQIFSVATKDRKVVLGSPDPSEATHRLRFEASLTLRNPHLSFTPSPDQKSWDSMMRPPDFEASDWYLVDINGMSGEDRNYPITPREGLTSADPERLIAETVPLWKQVEERARELQQQQQQPPQQQQQQQEKSEAEQKGEGAQATEQGKGTEESQDTDRGEGKDSADEGGGEKKDSEESKGKEEGEKKAG
ncbi:unnamed protein product [Vitrella brassicaformis CCMP3155]|uniref:Uncharacterized protein n=2 Tax=Vitrella brassicaformis TaxID=1169539 RepID=A0A0G4G579_VITBC|nr:unnamed protein product [Vitrella brassicaformis CCMP3155]|eukprot:CEM23666.1 unnamed protein product [Vitrella brassicaformis CCMP3155]